MSDNGNGTSIINKPTGGGAISGMGEKFSPDLFTGTGNFSVPIALPPGRNGFQPDITIGYSSGNGSGMFGLGWNLSIPGVSRKTSKGIPLYDDDKDVFILSGAEDLVEVSRELLESGGYKATFRPRTEGLFARIERYNDATNDYWKVWSKDGLISYYGTPEQANTVDSYNDPAVCADPAYRSKVFQWYLSKTEDVFGNKIVYSYTRENRSVTASLDDPHDYDMIYLSAIRYADYDTDKFLCSVSFLYEDRPDPISVYKQGFEIRTTKRATTIEIYTHPEVASVVQNILSKKYHFVYLDKRVQAGEVSVSLLPLNGVSLLSQVKIEGVDGENSEWMPPLEFGYSGFEPNHRKFDPITGNDMPPVAMSNPDYEMADLFGNGLPDIVQLNGVARYWRNLGEGKYDLPRFIKEVPAGAKLADPQIQLVDANGDGRLDLLYNKPGVNGYYSMKPDGLWDHSLFKRHKFTPSFSLSDPEVKLLDLDGDGITDALRNGSRLECFLNDQEQGFYKTITVEKKQIKNFPNLSFADPRIRFADMSGDGLQDIVQVQDGNICYWPNLGYGRFGAMVQMKHSPRFPFRYDPALIQLGDVDGDGCTDLVYIETNQVTLWINKCGEGWSDPIVIVGTPSVTDPGSIRFTDVKGTGIAGLLWSYDVDLTSSGDRMFYLDFSQGVKPYVLNEMNNHMGAITRVEYKSSIYYYLLDQQKSLSPFTRTKGDDWELGALPNGKRTPWKTTLPFPVQVVSKVEVIDELSQGKLVTEYSYHHGYWDGGEREFRGFGRVHQRDTESFQRYNNLTTTNQQQTTNFLKVEDVHYTPPTETISWFHLGPIGAEQGEWEEVYFEDEYWGEDPQVLKRPEEMINMIKALPRRARRDAYRTLRGSSLRTELYALDNDTNSQRPYTVTENLQGVRLEHEHKQLVNSNQQPFGPDENNKHGSGYVFFAQGLSSRTTQWERGKDPMTSFSFAEDYDIYGNPQMLISMAVPRRKNPLTGTGSSESYLVTMSETKFAHNTISHYLIGKVTDAKSYEVVNNGNSSVFALRTQIIQGQTTFNLLSHSLTYYDGAAFIGLDHGIIGDYGVSVRTESLVMTEEDLDIYETPPVYLQISEMPDPIIWPDEYPDGFIDFLPSNAGYLFYEEDSIHKRGFYCTSDRKKFDFHDNSSTAKGLMLESKDPLGNITSIAYDDYKLFPVTVTEPMGIVMSSLYNYRVMQVSEITDPNENRTQFAFSPLGFLIKTYVLGKVGEPVGDNDPEKPGTLMEYNFFAFYDKHQPAFVKTIIREHHSSDEVEEDIIDDTIISVQYSDGFGRLIQTRTQAEETIFGDSIFGDSGLDPAGESDGDAEGLVVDSGETNVIVSGWQVYNNKGNVVEKYEPYYDKGFRFVAPAMPDVLQTKSHALEFNGAAQINFKDATQYHFGVEDFTVEAWVNFTSSGNNTIVSNNKSSEGIFGFDLYQLNGKFILFVSEGGRESQVSTDDAFPVNTWMHVVAQRIGNDGNDFKFYVNGELVASSLWATSNNLLTGDINAGAVSNMSIGGRNGSSLSDDYFTGMMRDVRLYRGAISQQKIQANCKSGIGGPVGNDSNLVLYASLDEITGKTIYDYSYYENAGIISGSGEGHVLLENGNANLVMALSQKIQTFYDPRSEVIKTVNPDKTEQRVILGVPYSLSTPDLYYPTPWESYTYDANDLKPITHPLDATVPEEHENTPSSFLIDALGRKVKTVDRNFVTGPGLEEIVMQYQYDIKGNLLKVLDPYGHEVFVHEYDFSNRKLKTIHMDGGVKYVVKDCVNNPIEARDEKGALVLNAYDDLQRPTKVWARDKESDNTTLRQKMLYGDSVVLVDPPEDNNLKGKLYKQYDEAGRTTIPAYDHKGLILEKVREVIGNTELLNVFAGPPADWAVEVYRVNWNDEDETDEIILDPKLYVTSLEYDALGRITKLTYPEDKDSERKELVPSYNRSSTLESVTLDGELYVDRIAYNARGQKILTAFGNGIMTRYIYRSDNFRLLRMKSEGYEKSTPGSTILYEKQSGTTKQNFTYEYDLSGNIISITDTTTGCGVEGADELVRIFEYDAMYRLLSATGRETAAASVTPWNDCYRPQNNNASRGYEQNYTYDKLGNMLTLQHITNDSSANFTRVFNPDLSGDPVGNYGVKNLLNRIKIGANNYDFEYDVNGNMTKEGTNRHFQYDYTDRLKSFYIQATDEEPSQFTQYFYDAYGNRVKKLSRSAGGNIKMTVYIDGIFEHTVAESNPSIPSLPVGTWYIGYGTGEQNTLHILDGSSRVATLRVGDDLGDTTPEKKFNLEDHLGSSNLLLDADGVLVSREEYYPFGETSFGSYGRKRYRFCGKEMDEESGLYYYGLRYYNAWTCRFINIDPLAPKYPFYTPYQYAGNMPINFIDLDGAEPGKSKVQTDGQTTTQIDPQNNGTVELNTTPSNNGIYVWNLGEDVNATADNPKDKAITSSAKSDLDYFWEGIGYIKKGLEAADEFVKSRQGEAKKMWLEGDYKQRFLGIIYYADGPTEENEADQPAAGCKIAIMDKVLLDALERYPAANPTPDPNHGLGNYGNTPGRTEDFYSKMKETMGKIDATKNAYGNSNVKGDIDRVKENAKKTKEKLTTTEVSYEVRLVPIPHQGPTHNSQLQIIGINVKREFLKDGKVIKSEIYELPVTDPQFKRFCPNCNL